MRTGLSLLFAGLLCGVAACHAQAIDDHAQREIESIHADTQSLLMAASCLDGAVLRPACGLVSQRVAMPDFREAFAAKKCADVSTEVCQEKFDRAVSAWMVQRYSLADVRGVEVYCDANPGRCDDPKVHEMLLLNSHNTAVSDLGARRASDAIAKRDLAHAVDAQQTTDAVLLGVVLVGTVVSRHHHHHYRW
jgi:hypothetical protein